METELFMECEEEELEPWQQVDDSVEEEEMDFVDYYGEPVEDTPSPLPASETPPTTTPSITPAPTASPPLQLVSSVMLPPPPPPLITSSRLPAPSAPPLMTQGPPLILTQTAGGTFLLPAAPGTGGGQPFFLTTQMTNVERFRFEDARGRTFESRGEMVMCGGCGGKFFRIVSHLKKSRTCSSHLDLDKFEKLLILYNRKRKRKPEAKASEETSGFSVVTAFAH